MSRRFFITLDIYQEAWHGSLTVEQQAYLWLSADVGDAYLLSTAPRGLEDAIGPPKAEMVRPLNAFSIVQG